VEIDANETLRDGRLAVAGFVLATLAAGQYGPGASDTEGKIGCIGRERPIATLGQALNPPVVVC
jgi:hypothetical protein